MKGDSPLLFPGSPESCEHSENSPSGPTFKIKRGLLPSLTLFSAHPTFLLDPQKILFHPPLKSSTHLWGRVHRSSQGYWEGSPSLHSSLQDMCTNLAVLTHMVVIPHFSEGRSTQIWSRNALYPGLTLLYPHARLRGSPRTSEPPFSSRRQRDC